VTAARPALVTRFGWACHARARPREHGARQVVEIEAPSMRFASIGMRNMHTLAGCQGRAYLRQPASIPGRFMLREGCS
jgi:hypothetical protein